MNPTRPRGIIAATPTPVHADFTPDLARLLAHCRQLLEGGCDAINLLGTTGEATAFGVEQRLTIMEAVAESGLPMSRFLVGTGLCSLTETARLTRAACSLGFAGALVVPPFYYPVNDSAGLLQYIDELITRVDSPALALYLYHIPQNTGVGWPLETVAELQRRHPAQVLGLKDSAGDLSYARALAQALPGFDVFPSSEAALSTAREDGFAGCISATTNLTAASAQAGWSATDPGIAAAAFQRAGAQRTLLSAGSLIANVKAALAQRYDDETWARVLPPLVSAPTDQARALYAALGTAG
ncbi:dihydrodipicolinate synthase family protein [Aquabacterium sp.]|uniref:dihydrodipicolinate synthase family protein n=1 Tax=Aquabacterium sp. TaxID=1872578 RepID=UPI002BC5D0D5|nr:dihydrodipicolinate synthase family protein [Aquabacterium sp.]HSW03910.1 dihydrodipicolinate synthase family protein [Aquabacterium sp.]